MVEPNLQSILITNAMGVVLLMSLFLTSYFTRERRQTSDLIFTTMIFVCAGACVCEAVTWFSDGHATPLAFFLNYFGNTYCYIATNVYLYMWVLYVDMRLHRGEEHVRHWYPGLLIPIAILVLAVIGNLFGHYMFIIDENNVYSRKPAGYLIYVMMLVTLFYSIWVKISFQRKHGKVRFFPISVFLVPVIVGAVLQALFFGISLAWPCVAIALVSIHMSQQNELSYIDRLTGLYNRTYLDYALQVMQRRDGSGGLMVDMDFFKEINDSYGHSAGDEALKRVAHILTECSPHESLAIRMAGDEFIVLLRDTSVDELEKIRISIVESVRAFNESGERPYKLMLSIGYSMFRPSDVGPDEFLHRVDARMYAEKRQHHEASESDDR